MDHQLDAGLVGNGTDFAEEIYQVGTQLFGGDVPVTVKLFLEMCIRDRNSSVLRSWGTSARMALMLSVKPMFSISAAASITTRCV